MTDTKSQPLYVDLDGTLIFTDTVDEMLWLALRHRPLCLLRTLLRGIGKPRALLKSRLYDLTEKFFDPVCLPYNIKLLDWLAAHRQSWQKLIVISGSDQRVVGKITDHINRQYPDLLSASFGSDRQCNLIAGRKHDLLKRLSGGDVYSYIGNAAQDVEPWQGAITSGGAAFVVNPGPATRRAVKRAQIDVKSPVAADEPPLDLKALVDNPLSRRLATLIIVPFLLPPAMPAAQLIPLLLTITAFVLAAVAGQIGRSLLRSGSAATRGAMKLSMRQSLMSYPALIAIAVALAAAGSSMPLLIVYVLLATLVISSRLLYAGQRILILLLPPVAGLSAVNAFTYWLTVL